MTDDNAMLTYGALAIDEYGDEDGIAAFAPLSEGFDTGAPEILTEALPRLLLDGEDVVGERSGNRSLTFLVRVSGGDGYALNYAEKLLALEVQKPRNTLRLQLDPDEPASVYDTFRGKLTQVFGEVWDLQATRAGRKYRTYQVTCPARPFPRAENMVVEDAFTYAATADVDLIDACDALTGWTGPPRTMSLETSQKLTGTGSIGSQTQSPYAYEIDGLMWGERQATYHASFVKTFTAQDVSTQPYITLALIGTGLSVTALLRLDGQACAVVSQVSESGWRRFTFRVPSGMTSFTSFNLLTSTSKVYPNVSSLPEHMSILLDDVNRSNQPGGIVSGRQSGSRVDLIVLHCLCRM